MDCKWKAGKEIRFTGELIPAVGFFFFPGLGGEKNGEKKKYQKTTYSELEGENDELFQFFK